MAKTDTASNRRMSFLILLGPFELLRAFRLEPKAKMTGRVAVREARSYFGTVLGGNVRGNGLRTFHESNRANGETEKSEEEKERLEARGGIEPPIMVLQTIALPLGYRATGRKSCQFSVISCQLKKKQ